MDGNGFGKTGTEDAKDHIQKIYERYEKTDRSVLKGFANTVRLNLQNFPSTAHFIIEFIQNADDAGSHNFKLSASDELILVTNDGKTFTREDVESICNSASSNKSPEYNLGYLGVGFKSCFKISTSPQIRSGIYSFRFDKDTIGDLGLPYELMPIWVDDELNDGETEFKLPLIDDEKIKSIIADQLNSEAISGKLILFLKNLEEIHIIANIANENLEKTIKKISSPVNEDDYTIYRTEEVINSKKSFNEWAVFRKTYEVPEKISNDALTKQFKREGIKKREILIALELDEHDQIVLGRGSIHFGVYSFLPLRDLTTTFRFIIQGDFLTNPGRSDIHREAAWNSWIADCVYDLIVSTCVPAVLKNDLWKYNVGKIFHVDTSANEVINKRIIEPLQNYINNEPVFFDINDNLVSSKEAIEISKDVTNLLGLNLVSELYGKMPLNDKVGYDGGMPNLERGPDSIVEFMVCELALKLLKKMAKERNLEWFIEFHRKLSKTGFDEQDVRQLRGVSFIVDGEFDLIKPEDARVATDVQLQESMLSEFKTPHPSLCEDESILKLFREVLKIKDLTSDDIREVNQYTPEQWENANENERIDFIRYLFRRQDKPIPPLSYLTLPTKNGSWAKPEETVFPSEFSPDYDIEKLIFGGLLRVRVPKFVSPKLFSAQTDQKSQWRTFLKTKLGCENDDFLKKIAEEIGVEAVKLYEERNGCVVHDPRSPGLNEDPGYDWESTDPQGNVKLIEVKGGKERYGFNISLSRNEHRALFQKRDVNAKNYVYAVKNALDEPEINILEGDDIRSLTARLLINETGKDGWGKICKGKFNVI